FLAAEDLPPEGAEGYLFPETYAFPLATPQDRILRTMIHQFREVFGPEMTLRAADLGLTEQEAVTLASLIEEETGRPADRRPVAAGKTQRRRRPLPEARPVVGHGADTARVSAGAGWGSRRFRAARGAAERRGGGARAHEPATPPGARAHPRMRDADRLRPR